MLSFASANRKTTISRPRALAIAASRPATAAAASVTALIRETHGAGAATDSPQQLLSELARAAPGVRVMHPGPMNRGVEIDSDVADDLEVSLIQDQVEMGVATRMAVLASLAARLDNR